MALPLSNSFEGGSNGTTITTGNSGGASGDAFGTVNILGSGGNALIYDSTRAAHGTLSAKITEGTTAGVIDMEWTSGSVGTVTELWGRVYVYRTATPAATLNLVRCFPASLECGRVLWGVDDKLYTTDSAIASTASTATMSLNQWIRIEWHLICSTVGAGTFSADAYALDATGTPMATVSKTSINSGANCVRVIVGNGTGPGGLANDVFWIDDFALSGTGVVGPVATGASYVETGAGIIG